MFCSMNWRLNVLKKTYPPNIQSFKELKIPFNISTEGDSKKTAATYSPTVTQYHRRDEA